MMIRSALLILAGALAGSGCNQNLSSTDAGVPDLGGDLAMPDLAHEPYGFGGPCAGGAECLSGVCLPSAICGLACGDNSQCPPSADWSCAGPPDGGQCACNAAAPGVEVCDGHDNDCNGLVDDVATTQRARYVINNMLIPATRSDYSIDLNGDGTVDNQLASILSTLQAQLGISAQTQLDSSIMNGSTLYLIALGANDATFTSDACANLSVQRGVPGSPRFDGTDTLTVDATQPTGRYLGAITASRFVSAPLPPATTIPVQMTLALPVLASTIELPITATQIQVTHMGDQLMQGRLQGVIRRSDIDIYVVPQVVGFANLGAVNIFDNGGTPAAGCNNTCKNPDGTCAVSGDMHVDFCEVSTSTIFVSLFAPDVQMFDAQGNFRPNPANTTRDSISLGVAFTAVRAQF